MLATLRKLLRRAQLAWDLRLELCITTQISVSPSELRTQMRQPHRDCASQLGKSVRAAARVGVGDLKPYP